MDFETIEVTDDEERRILQVFAILEKLFEGGVQVFVFAFVFPGEEATHPDVGEAIAAEGFGDSLLEGVGVALLVDFGGGRLAEDFAEAEEVLLGGAAFGEGGALPACDEIGDGERGHLSG
jgi:hypothetical protein